MEVILQSAGVVSGAFGFVELYKSKQEQIRAWLDDASEKVRAFAQQYIRHLDRRIAEEYRRSQQDVELRKREYDDDGDDTADREPQ